jgi:hypothetical protein
VSPRTSINPRTPVLEGLAQGADSGIAPEVGNAREGEPTVMPIYLLHHRHRPAECEAAFAAWQGFSSELRGSAALSNCLEGGHELWWVIPARDAAAVIELMPRFVAERSSVTRVREVSIP